MTPPGDKRPPAPPATPLGAHGARGGVAGLVGLTCVPGRYGHGSASGHRANHSEPLMPANPGVPCDLPDPADHRKREKIQVAKETTSNTFLGASGYIPEPHTCIGVHELPRPSTGRTQSLDGAGAAPITPPLPWPRTVPWLAPLSPQSWLPTPLGDDQQGRLQSRRDPRKDLPSMPCSQWREKKHTCGHKEWHSVFSVPLTRPRHAATLCCAHPHVSTHTHAPTQSTHAHIPTHTHTRTHAHTCTRTHTHTHVPTYMHTYPRTHPHMYPSTPIHAADTRKDTQKQGTRPSQQGAQLTLAGSAALAVSPQEASLSPDQTSLAGSRHSHNTSWARKSPAHVIRRNTLGNDSLPWRPARVLRHSVPLTQASCRGLGPGWAAASVQSKQWTIVGADVCDSHGSETTALRPPTSKPAGPAEQARGPGGD